MTRLVLVDLDLESRAVTVVHEPRGGAGSAQGVHLLAWWHGEPVGHLVRAGRPSRVLPAVVAEAAGVFEGEVREHAVRDALAVDGGLDLLARRGPAAVPHPPAPALAPEVSVAVCTRDRPEDLHRCLEAISRLRGEVAEVVVVDNAPRLHPVERVVQQFPGVRYVREPRPGLDWARNRALLECRSPVVAFTDDDVLVHPGWVSALRRTFAEEPDAAAVTGLVMPAELETPAQVAFEAQGGFRRGHQRAWFSAAVPHETAAARAGRAGAMGTGANLAVRRDVALAVGGFDTALDVGTPTGGGGDLEVLFRLVATGHLVVYDPTALVRHRHRREHAALVRQRRGDGSGTYAFWLGAGRRYAPAERAALGRIAAGWCWRHFAKRAATSLVWPELSPRSLVLAELAGAAQAVRGAYATSRSEAARRAAAHPGEPAVPPLVHRPVEVPSHDLTTGVQVLDAWTGRIRPETGRAPGPRRGAAELSVLVAGRPIGTLTVTGVGRCPPAARWRWELSQRAVAELLDAAALEAGVLS